jgi:hypothetical protein
LWGWWRRAAGFAEAWASRRSCRSIQARIAVKQRSAERNRVTPESPSSIALPGPSSRSVIQTTAAAQSVRAATLQSTGARAPVVALHPLEKADVGADLRVIGKGGNVVAGIDAA